MCSYFAMIKIILMISIRFCRPFFCWMAPIINAGKGRQRHSLQLHVSFLGRSVRPFYRASFTPSLKGSTRLDSLSFTHMHTYGRFHVRIFTPFSWVFKGRFSVLASACCQAREVKLFCLLKTDQVACEKFSFLLYFLGAVRTHTFSIHQVVRWRHPMDQIR